MSISIGGVVCALFFQNSRKTLQDFDQATQQNLVEVTERVSKKVRFLQTVNESNYNQLAPKFSEYGINVSKEYLKTLMDHKHDWIDAIRSFEIQFVRSLWNNDLYFSCTGVDSDSNKNEIDLDQKRLAPNRDLVHFPVFKFKVPDDVHYDPKNRHFTVSNANFFERLFKRSNQTVSLTPDEIEARYLNEMMYALPARDLNDLGTVIAPLVYRLACLIAVPFILYKTRQVNRLATFVGVAGVASIGDVVLQRRTSQMIAQSIFEADKETVQLFPNSRQPIISFLKRQEDANKLKTTRPVDIFFAFYTSINRGIYGYTSLSERIRRLENIE